MSELRDEIRADLAKRCLEMLDVGTVPWRKPWQGEGGLPVNVLMSEPDTVSVQRMYVSAASTTSSVTKGLRYCRTVLAIALTPILVLCVNA